MYISIKYLILFQDMLSMVEDEDDDSHINPSEDPASNFVSMGSVLDMKGAGSSLAKSISFDEKKPAYPQVMSLFNDVVTEVGGNPVLLRNLFKRLKDQACCYSSSYTRLTTKRCRRKLLSWWIKTI